MTKRPGHGKHMSRPETHRQVTPCLWKMWIRRSCRNVSRRTKRRRKDTGASAPVHPPRIVRWTVHCRIRFPIAIIVGRLRNVASGTKCDKLKLAGTCRESGTNYVPDAGAWPKDRNISFSVAVIIGDDRSVARRTKLYYPRRCSARLRDEPRR